MLVASMVLVGCNKYDIDEDESEDDTGGKDNHK